jgi:hypothetical protein
MSQPRPKTRPKVAWELYVTYEIGIDLVWIATEVSRAVGHAPVRRSDRRSDLGAFRYLVYELPDKAAAQNAKRRVKAKLKSQVSCDIVPCGAG